MINLFAALKDFCTDLQKSNRFQRCGSGCGKGFFFIRQRFKRGNGLAGNNLLHGANLFRFQRLFRYGDRPRQDVQYRTACQFRRALPRLQHQGILAEMAYHAVTLFITYVYIPLGGSKKGKTRMLLNTFIVFLLSGLWHGAAWTYVAWGAMQGLLVVWDNLGIIGINGREEKRPARYHIPAWLGWIFYLYSL